MISESENTSTWKIRVDTGGTFTDCWALAPGDETPRLVKILSSATLRIAVSEKAEDRAFRVVIPPNWNVPRDFFFGFRVSEDVFVTRWDPFSKTLFLSADLPGTPSYLDLSTGEEAPVLGARLLTGTGSLAQFPKLDFRLATTRGTNALLERKGAPVAFFVTKGFRDLLVIRDQRRPDLFARQHIRPDPLYEEVIEIEERLTDEGTVLRAYCGENMREIAEGLLARGIRVAAVAFLHSHVNPAHELALQKDLLKLGFEHVSISSALAPLIKIVPRAETAVVNAYLTPVMDAFVENVRSAIKPPVKSGENNPYQLFSGREFILRTPLEQAVTKSLGGRSYPTIPVIRAQTQLTPGVDEGVWTAVDSERNAEEIARQESELEAWTRVQGLFFEPEEIMRLGDAATQISEGNEHRAFHFEEDHLIVRLTRGNQYGLPWKTPRQYLQRWVEFNAFTPQTGCRFLGFARNNDGKGVILTVQPFVAGEKPHPDTIMDEMYKLGFETGDGIIYYREDGLEMADVTPDNVRIDPAGDFRIFDTWLIDRNHVLRSPYPEEDAEDKPVSENPLLLMTSAGGLEPAATFSPKDSLLSGPAGGVAGAAAIARDLGLGKILTFDMGGTSTDVARYDVENGGFQYQFEQKVGDANLLSPALKIHTVAAGGRSICYRHEVTGDIRVGPESAGADPGPACYGRGGPLTVTDVNLLLGRIDPDNFGIPIGLENISAARKALAEISEGEPEAFLHGLVEIAVEQMADAIRTISIRDGANPADYALLAFGGAGPLHACDIAEKLGIRKIVIPAEAGVLSAYGLHQAEVERFAERQVLESFEEFGGQIPDILDELKERAARQLRRDLGERSGLQIETRRQIAEVRLKGQDAALALEISDPKKLRGAFQEKYETVFGYPPSTERALEVVTLRVVVVALDSSLRTNRVGSANEQGPFERASRTNRVRSANQPCLFVDRATLAIGESVEGEVVIQDPFSTFYLKPSWTAKVEENGALVAMAENDAG